MQLKVFEDLGQSCSELWGYFHAFTPSTADPYTSIVFIATLIMLSHRFRSSLLPVSFAIAIAALLWPSDALAWGPLAHLSFSSGALESLSLLTPSLRFILSHHANEFLYGSLAADIIVGKNLARYAVHCHNWTIGFRVFERARGNAQKAFSLGFLSHLAADTVAHNYYVPYKTVQSFRSRASGHAYWELRFDQKLSPDLWQLARRVTSASYREHDDHLEACLAESYVIPFSVSKRLFGSLLLAARLKKWQRMSELVAGERDLELHDEEVQECHKLAIGQIVGILQHGESASCTGADPTGGRNLHLATEFKSRLKRRTDLKHHQTDETVRQTRPAFRQAIHGRLLLPHLPDREAA